MKATETFKVRIIDGDIALPKSAGELVHLINCALQISDCVGDIDEQFYLLKCLFLKVYKSKCGGEKVLLHLKNQRRCVEW